MSQCNVARVRLLATLICSPCSTFVSFYLCCLSLSVSNHFKYIFTPHLSSFLFLCIHNRFVSFYFIFIRCLCVCVYVLILFSSFYLIYPALIPFVYEAYIRAHTHLPYSCHGLFYWVYCRIRLCSSIFNIPSKYIYTT